MERGLILLVAALVVYVAPAVQGTSHLSFSTNNGTLNITRNGCGGTKLCVESPNGCNPNDNGTCQFTSLDASSMSTDGTNVSVELSGYGMGFVAMGLTMNASVGNTTLFICAQNASNNNSFFFRTVDRDNVNNSFTPNERITREIRGMVNGSRIKCTFELPFPNTTTRISSSTFQVLLGNGTYNSSGFGPFNLILTSRLLNITNVNGTIMDSSGAVLPHAVLILMSVLSLFFVFGA